MKIISLFLIAGLLSCVHQPRDIAGGTSEQGNAFVTGRLLTSTGKPAKGAKVRVYTIRHNPQTGAGKALAVVDSATTNDSGVFTIDTLPADTFNIFGDSGTSLSYADSIPVGQDTVIIPPDTLEAPGSLVGTIQLRAGDDPRKVLALFFGSTAYALPDSLGRFTLSNLAAGEYSVRFLPTGNIDYAVLDTSLTVNSGQTDTVVVKLKFTGIPTPTGLIIAYDTLKQIVTLTWNREDTALVKGFNVYRRNLGLNGNPAQLGGVVVDTVYRDSAGVQDSTYEYQVAAVNKTNQEGNKSVASNIRIESGFRLINNIQLKTSIGGIHSFFIASDSNLYVAYSDSGQVVVFNPNGDSLKTFGKGMFQQLYGVVIDSRMNAYTIDPDKSRLLKFNQNGDSITSWTISVPVEIAINKKDEIYIVNSQYRAISKFDTLGNLIKNIVLPANMQTIDLAIDSQNNTTAGDFVAQDFKIFDENLQLLRTLKVTLADSGFLRLGEFDGSGHVFVEVERSAGKTSIKNIQVFNESDGTYLGRWYPQLYFRDFKIYHGTVYVTNGINILRSFLVPSIK